MNEAKRSELDAPDGSDVHLRWSLPQAGSADQLTAQMPDEPAPCPFCGGRMKMIREGGRPKGRITGITPIGLGCDLCWWVGYALIEDECDSFIDRWNQRVAVPDQKGLP